MKSKGALSEQLRLLTEARNKGPNWLYGKTPTSVTNEGRTIKNLARGQNKMKK